MHIIEAFYATVGYNPAPECGELDTNQLFGDAEETKRDSQIDMMVNKYVNPYATRLPANWQKVYLMTFLEIDCQIRFVMLKAIRKALKKKLKGKSEFESDSDDDSDVEEFANDFSKGFNANKNQQQQHRQCCSHDHGGHSHHGHRVPTQPMLGRMPISGGMVQNPPLMVQPGTELRKPDLDQSTAILDTSVDL